VQGLNDFLIFTTVGVSATLSGVLHELVGWQAMNLMALPAWRPWRSSSSGPRRPEPSSRGGRLGPPLPVDASPRRHTLSAGAVGGRT
jgi:hypothetical protein